VIASARQTVKGRGAAALSTAETISRGALLGRFVLTFVDFGKIVV